MNESTGISAEAFREALIASADHVIASREDLCALDAIAGDGDLGATLATGFTHVRDVIEGFQQDDVGAMLTQTGVGLGRKAPSTIGALLATAFMNAGRELDGVSELDASHVVVMSKAMAAGVAERGHVTTGMRTILDAMESGSAAAANASEHGAGATVALREAAVGARAGAEATAGMEPQVGRAGWLKDRARGTVDAGAMAWATFLDGLAEGLPHE